MNDLYFVVAAILIAAIVVACLISGLIYGSYRQRLWDNQD